MEFRSCMKSPNKTATLINNFSPPSLADTPSAWRYNCNKHRLKENPLKSTLCLSPPYSLLPFPSVRHSKANEIEHLMATGRNRKKNKFKVS